MKAVILEVKNGYAAALKDDGTVVKIKDENYKVGDVIRMKEKKPLFNKKCGTLVAALLIFAMVGTSTYVNAAPSFDVWVEDGSDGYEILFQVNRFNKVISVVPGEKVDDYIDVDIYEKLEDMDLEGLDIEEAILRVVDEIDFDEEYYVTATAMNNGDPEKLAQKIRERIAEEEGLGNLDRERIVKNVESVGNDLVQEAKSEKVNISPGKLNIVNKLVEAEEDIDFEFEYDDAEDLREELIEIAQKDPKDLMKIFSESKGNKNGVKFQEELDDEDFDDEDLNKDGKVNGKDTAPGQNELKPDDDPDDSLKPEKEKSNNGNDKGNGNN